MSKVDSSQNFASKPLGAALSFGDGAAGNPFPWRRIAIITVGAVALFVGFRYLPTGTNLSHMDFRAAGQNVIETCDPANPQFIPVVAVKSPVAMTLALSAPAVSGAAVNATATLKTASGKAIAPEDLVVMHTKLLHLLIADPTLQDYQHVHPTAGREPGTWIFSFTPKLSGTYRVFADFTPVATGRSLYANADLAVKSSQAENAASTVVVATTPALSSAGKAPAPAVLGDYRFTLVAGEWPIRARKMADLKFTVARIDGGHVPMEPVMGAYAHLVAFDETRSGFAHLHPMETELIPAPDGRQPKLNFKITIPAAGRYVIWSQVNLSGHEMFAPFWFDVAP